VFYKMRYSLSKLWCWFCNTIICEKVPSPSKNFKNLECKKEAV
jgi:hypothetical protein